ncbi:MAG TPA: CPBP family intramembrane metalloprotease, partial [Nanoarchaeota archaeon]|nr:CPBP family intramembrane metalloprotease [Nanoarchaeota archaeon]
MNKKELSILFGLILLSPIFLILSRLFLPTNYLFSSLYKLIFLFPLFYYIYIEKKSLKNIYQENFSFKTVKNTWKKMCILGLGIALIYITTFFLLKGFVDISSIIQKLELVATINTTNIIFIGAYIIFINSLLEEFFWRGFIFKKMKENIGNKAYIITGLAFSLHHMMFYYNWFTLPFFLIVTVGLSAYAILMNFIFDRYKDLYSCWLVHALADTAQIGIA